MGDEYDYRANNFEAKAVSKFETLRRFEDYTELQDGTLMAGRGR
jgi:hypothetical protein